MGWFHHVSGYDVKTQRISNIRYTTVPIYLASMYGYDIQLIPRYGTIGFDPYPSHLHGFLSCYHRDLSRIDALGLCKIHGPTRTRSEYWQTLIHQFQGLHCPKSLGSSHYIEHFTSGIPQFSSIFAHHQIFSAPHTSWWAATPCGFDNAMYGGFSKDPMGCAQKGMMVVFCDVLPSSNQTWQ